MSKYLGMNDSELRAMKGAELKQAAVDLDIPGRSSMKAAELREAIVAYFDPQTGGYLTKSVTDEGVAVNETVHVVENAPEHVHTVPTPTRLANMLARFREAREAKHAAGVMASYDSQSAAPMTTFARIDNYREMNNGGPVRPGKQARRIAHKHNKNFA